METRLFQLLQDPHHHQLHQVPDPIIHKRRPFFDPMPFQQMYTPTGGGRVMCNSADLGMPKKPLDLYPYMLYEYLTNRKNMEVIMSLTRDKVLDVLVTVLQEIQEDIVGEPEQITDETVPIGNLSDFDSLASVEATVDILVRLGFEIDEFPSYPSLFIKQHNALNVGQVADRILRLNSRRN